MKLALALAAALALGALPLLTSSNYVIGVGVSALIFTVAAAALNLVYGFTGLLSFAQLAFWGIGGYASALTVVTFGGTFWWGLVWAALINAVVALVVGYPTLRTNRHAFVIVTLTFALLASLVARDWVSLTRGPLGIPNLPPPSAFGHRFGTTGQFYWIAWAFSVAMLAFLYALCSSRIGRTLVAIKQNEPLVRAQGISPMPYKLAAFAIGAAVTGAAGGVFSFHLGIVDPTFLDFYYMQTFLIIVIIGGAGSFWGVVVAGIALSALPEVLRFSADLRMIIYGVILVVAVFVMPSGIAGWLRDRRVARMREALTSASSTAGTELGAPLPEALK
jgi:ABC-type branched-subunit amino acid transport system permease subunit